MAFIRGISIVIPGDCLIDTSRWHMLYVVEGGGESAMRERGAEEREREERDSSRIFIRQITEMRELRYIDAHPR